MFPALLALSVVFIGSGIYKVSRPQAGYSGSLRRALVAGFATLLFVDCSAFIPGFIDSGLWWYMLAGTPVVSIAVALPMWLVDRRLVLYLVPQLLFAIMSGASGFFVLTKGINFGW